MIENIAGIVTRYEKTGSGPPVVVLHGWGAALESVRPIAQGLGRSHTLFAMDLPGFGQSQPPPEQWGMYEYAAWVGAFLEHVGCPQAHVIGHSFGGRVAIVLAARHPQRVGRLILVDSAGIKPKRSWQYYLRVYPFKAWRWAVRLLPRPVWQNALRERIHTWFGSADYRAAAGPMRSVFVRVVNEDLRPLLPEIKAPTLLIWGENDRDVPPADGKIMAREIPQARLEILTGAGHFAYLDRLPRFCQLAHDFLKEEQ